LNKRLKLATKNLNVALDKMRESGDLRTNLTLKPSDVLLVINFIGLEQIAKLSTREFLNKLETINSKPLTF
jgi:hypothetical protein